MKIKLITITFITMFVNNVFATTYTAGHADLGLGDHDQLELHVHVHEGSTIDGSTIALDEEYAPEAVTILVPNSTMFPRPEGSAWDLIGNNAGDNTWFLPKNGTDAQSMGAPFLGIGAEHIEAGAFVNDQITLRLTDVSGPGHFSLYTVSLGNPTFEMASFGGITSDDSITLDLDIEKHAHFNFGFSQYGQYQIAFEVSAIDAVTQNLVTDSGIFTFHVVPEPASVSLLAFGAIALLRRKK